MFDFGDYRLAVANQPLTTGFKIINFSP